MCSCLKCLLVVLLCGHLLLFFTALSLKTRNKYLVFYNNIARKK